MADVARPASVEELARLLADCSASGRCVRVADGAHSDDDRLHVSLARITGVTEYEPDDLTIGARAGTPLGELDAEVARHAQRLPLDPPARDGTTLGAVLARGVSGPLAASLGPLRRQVLGLELVTGDGRVLRAGGRVVKNVAGYDLVRLMVGARGAFGIITAAHLRLAPRPEHSALRMIDGEPADLARLAREVERLSVEPASLELIGPPWRLVACYEGSRSRVDAGARAFDDAASGSIEADDRTNADHADDATDANHAGDPTSAHLDGHRRPIASPEAGAAIRVRMNAPPAALPLLMEAAADLADAGASVAAHATRGEVRAWWVHEQDVVIAVEQAAAALPPAATLRIERGPPALRERVHAPPVEPAVRDLIDGLRRVFDPAGILPESV